MAGKNLSKEPLEARGGDYGGTTKCLNTTEGRRNGEGRVETVGK